MLENSPHLTSDPMNANNLEISVRGQMVRVPVLPFDGRNIICRGRWIKVASIHDEAFLDGEVVPNPEELIVKLKQWRAKPDIFQFSQKITSPNPKFNYPMEWDNFAVIPITTYEDWLLQAKKDVKENLRRAKREGVVIKACEYNDEFVWGIKRLYDETPIRQGMRFWHYNKDFESVKRENGTYRERAEYIGAYYENDLIGFIKMVYVGNIAKTNQVITKDRYFHKRPANALIAKAVEVCAQRGIKYFNYGFYQYPGKKESSLTDFKSRQGFRRFDFPRYFVPLTVNGRIYLAMGLHRGLKRLIPSRLLMLVLKARSIVHNNFHLHLNNWWCRDLKRPSKKTGEVNTYSTGA
jgi:hypothetical protein